MTLEQLEEACKLAREIRELKAYVDEWSKQSVPLASLLRDVNPEFVSRDDEISFIEKTRDRMCRKLDETERLLAAFPPTP